MVAEHLGHGPGGIVFRVHIVIKSGKHILQHLGIFPGKGDHLLHFHFRLGDGAGFVHAKHIHPGQGLDAVHIPHQHLLAAELQGRCRQRYAGQQVQTLGDHTHQSGNGAVGAGGQFQMLHIVLLIKQRNAHRDQGDAHHPDQGVHGTGHAAFLGLGVGFCLGSQLGGKGFRAHMGQPHPGRAGNHERAGLDFAVFLLFDGIGFAGDERFVDLHLPADHNAIGADLIAGPEFHNVIPHQFCGGNHLHRTVTDGPHRAGSHQIQLCHRPFGPDLLKNTDDGVDQHDDHKVQILHGRAAGQQKYHQHQKYQVEEGKTMGEDDLFFRFSRIVVGGVGEAGFLPPQHLHFGQTPLGICFFNGHRFDDHRGFLHFLSSLPDGMPFSRSQISSSVPLDTDTVAGLPVN